MGDMSTVVFFTPYHLIWSVIRKATFKNRKYRRVFILEAFITNLASIGYECFIDENNF